MDSVDQEPRLPILRLEIAWMTGLLALVVTYHWFTLPRQSLFVDEVNELLIARMSLEEIIAKPDSMPPLFSLILKGWVTQLGEDSARWLPALFGLATLFVVWLAVRRLVDRTTGIAAAVALGVSPFCLFYAQLVRSYSLFTLLAAVALALYAAAANTKRWSTWFAFAVVVALGMYAHYYFAFVPASLVLIDLCRHRGLMSGRLVAALVVAGLCAAPVYYCLESDFAFQKELRATRPLDVATVGYTYASFITGYTLGPPRSELHHMSSSEAIELFAPWAAAILVTSLPLALAGLWRLREFKLTVPIVILLVLPVLLAGGLGWAMGLTYNTRFVAWCVVPLAVLLGSGAVAWRKNGGLQVAAVGLLMISAIALYNRHFEPRYQNEDFRAVAAHLQQFSAPDEPLFIVSDYLANTLEYYLEGDFDVEQLPLPGETDKRVETKSDANDAIKRLTDQLPSGTESFWLVYSRPFHGDPKGHLLTTLETEFQLEEIEEKFAGVRLFRGIVR